MGFGGGLKIFMWALGAIPLVIPSSSLPYVFDPHLVSFTCHLFKNTWLELLYPWTRMYSTQANMTLVCLWTPPYDMLSKYKPKICSIGVLLYNERISCREGNFLIIHTTYCSFFYVTHFSCIKEKKELVFLNKEDFDFLWKGRVGINDFSFLWKQKSTRCGILSLNKQV